MMTRAPTGVERPLRSIRVRTWLALIALSIAVPITLFAIVVVNRFAQERSEAQQTDLATRANALAATVSQDLNGVTVAATALATSGELKHGDLNGFREEALSLLARFPLVSAISVMTGEGVVLCSTVQPCDQIRVPTAQVASAAEALESGLPTVSGLYIGQRTRRPVVAIDAPVPEASPLPRSVVRVVIYADQLNQLLAAQGLPPQWLAVLVDRGGVVIARSADAARFTGHFAAPFFLEALARAKSGLVEGESLEGVDIRTSYKTLEGSGWAVAVGAPRALMQAPVRRDYLMVGGSGGLVLVIGALLAFRLSRRLERRIARVVADAGGDGTDDAWATGIWELDRLLQGQRQGRAAILDREADLRAQKEKAEGISKILWQTVRELEVANDKVRRLIDSNIIGVAIMNDEGVVLEANDYYLRLLGSNREEFHPGELNGADFTPPEYLGQCGRAVAEMKERGISGAYEKQFLRPDGSRVWVETGLARLPHTEDTSVSFAIDITRRKEAEREAVAARDAAEKANLSKSRFLASASHDLRQPVQSLMLFHAVLAAELGEHPAAAPVLAHCKTALSALKDLLDGLLDVSRLEAGTVPVTISEFPIDIVLGPLAEEYRSRAAKKGLSLRAVPCGAIVRSDPALLGRVVRNLLENAIRYTETGKILIGCRLEGGHAQIVVADTGIGVAEEQQGVIFDDFFQAANPSRDRTQGLGLGLAIVRRTCRLLGHRISVVSAPGRGSRFTVSLDGRRLPVPRHAPPAARTQDEPIAGRVLVVDDEAFVVTAIANILSLWGLDVITATSGDDAVTALKGRAPDLALLDYRLRGETGLDVLGKIERAFGRPIPAYLLTGDTAPGLLAEVSQRGTKILHKPIDHAQLIDAVRQSLANAPF